MPRTKLDILTPSQQLAVLRRVVKSAMGEQDIESYTDLANRMSMSRQAVSRRINDGGWKYEELCQLIRVLHLGPNEVARMMGVREVAG